MFGSLTAKVIVAVSPLLRAALSLVMTSCGASVSIDNPSEPPAFALPVASAKTPAATATVPDWCEFAAGVKIAEYVLPVPAKLDSMPPVTTTSAAVKVVDASLKEKVSVAVSPIFRRVLVLVIVTVGRTPSTLMAAVAGGMRVDTTRLLFSSWMEEPAGNESDGSTATPSASASPSWIT